MKKLITISALIMALSLQTACQQGKKAPDLTKTTIDNDLKVEEYLCIKENTIETATAQAIRQTAERVSAFLQDNNYDKLLPYLTPDFAKSLETMGLKEKGNDIFFEGAADQLKNIKIYKITAVYLIKANPKKDYVYGFCKESQNDNTKNMFFNLKPPEKEQAGVFINGMLGKNSVNINLLLNKSDNEWKIADFKVYPTAFGTRTVDEYYQLATTIEKEGKFDIAYLLYKLITNIVPKSPIMPEYMVQSYKSIENLDKMTPLIPKTELKKAVSWQIDPENTVNVLDFKAAQIDNETGLVVTYLPTPGTLEEKDLEMELIAEYVKTKFPGAKNYFKKVFIQGIIPDPNNQIPPLTKIVDIYQK